MALIRCPECGKEISSTLGSCIHCGYQLNSQPVAAQPLVQEVVKLSPELEKAEKHAAEDIAYYKKASRIKNCALVLSSCMLIIGVILFFVWWKSYDSLKQLLYYRSFHGAIYSMIILAAIFFTADFFYNFFKEGYGPLRGAKRLKSEKADYAGYVKAHFGDPMSNVEQYFRFAHAAFLAENPKEKRFTLVNSVFSLLLNIICDLFGDIFSVC